MKRCYAWLCDFFVGGRVVVADQQRAMWLKLWKNNAPSKILIFAWRVLINKIATRDALSRRGVLRDDSDRRCVLCSSEDETVKHIFLDCRVAKKNMAAGLSLAGCSGCGRGRYSSPLYGIREAN